MKGGFTIQKYSKILILHLVRKRREFPGGSVVRTPGFHCWGPKFDPWLGYLLQYFCLENSTEEPGRLQSMGPQRVGHDWAQHIGERTFHKPHSMAKKTNRRKSTCISTDGEKAQLHCSNKQPWISVTSKSWSSCLTDAMSQVRWLGDWCGSVSSLTHSGSQAEVSSTIQNIVLAQS